MGSTFTSIERCLPAMRAGVIFAILVAASSAMAHDLPGNETKREIVRLQGYRNELPAGMRAQREMTLTIFGEEHKFYVVDWRRFRLTDEPPPGDTDPSHFTLQAKRAVLNEIAHARAGQRVTILGERRANGTDIFVLALDLCPSE